jgi:hypothetical protein
LLLYAFLHPLVLLPFNLFLFLLRHLCFLLQLL